ncbi:hypothetical protein [uncultured Chryseobacterium sp.]|uniref:hypothetical protein n=1 Tax=uncultured Chryseobacterium sp. TaxID=259322 RepID=UPI0025CFC852|nr:hypothetical protein [uncultured Chryseobacterium sp.]
MKETSLIIIILIMNPGYSEMQSGLSQQGSSSDQDDDAERHPTTCGIRFICRRYSK